MVLPIVAAAQTTRERNEFRVERCQNLNSFQNAPKPGLYTLNNVSDWSVLDFKTSHWPPWSHR